MDSTNCILYVIFFPFVTLGGIFQNANENEYTLQEMPEYDIGFGKDNYFYYEDPLSPIYITPENIDDVLKSLSFPSMQTLKERKKPFSFNVEGIVGTGKSTLLSAFKVQIHIWETTIQIIQILLFVLLTILSYF